MRRLSLLLLAAAALLAAAVAGVRAGPEMPQAASVAGMGAGPGVPQAAAAAAAGMGAGPQVPQAAAAGVLAGPGVPQAAAGAPAAKLSPDFYSQTCPRAERIIAEVVQSKQMANPTTAAGMLRVFFHDCFVTGCDASVLIAPTRFAKSEKDAEINHSLPGDAFDAVVRSKLALELECPGVVSCADVLALASRVLVTMTGGPRYPVPLGRKDSLSSSPTAPDVELPHSNFTVGRILELFLAKGFTVQEMVALSGAHTLGFSHCQEFASRIYNYRDKTGKPAPFDPTMNPGYAKGLQAACKEYLKDPTIAAFNDVMTPGKFDNMYYVNIERGLGLLSTDEDMWSDLRTRPLVERYAANNTAFFDDFARAMEKLSMYGVKTGADGEIRRRCDAYNDGPNTL
ncbi:peroxidase 31-like [Triticum dicoccoides]|uniref:peroxidase 31-like n=1 Tax=Triticum dicoccoides TaxID=85692 RepID=UPI001891E4C2|nr:peroxidase 31-like [Triticum dicoccoides]